MYAGSASSRRPYIYEVLDLFVYMFLFEDLTKSTPSASRSTFHMLCTRKERKAFINCFMTSRQGYRHTQDSLARHSNMRGKWKFH
jgi:hypothetical protein